MAPSDIAMFKAFKAKQPNRKISWATNMKYLPNKCNVDAIKGTA
jgi:hypothetical protein